MKIVTSWDDGRESDIWLAGLLRKYQLPAIFYIPSCCQLTEKDIKNLAIDFEIGGHTVTHPSDMKLLEVDEIAFQVSDNRKDLQRISGQKVESFCYPRGRYDERVISEVKKAGFTNARTTEVLSTLPAKDPFRTPTTIHAFQRSEYSQGWFDEAMKWFDIGLQNENSVYHLWGHSEEVLRCGLERELEELFKELNAYLYSK